MCNSLHTHTQGNACMHVAVCAIAYTHTQGNACMHVAVCAIAYTHTHRVMHACMLLYVQ